MRTLCRACAPPVPCSGRLIACVSISALTVLRRPFKPADTAFAAGTPDMLDRLAPALFVLLWSTGWLVARFAVDHADPLTFMAARHALAALAFAVVCLAIGTKWPRSRAAILHAILSGVLLHGLYLAGVWWAIGQGVPAGLSGIIAGLQPLLTAAAAPLLIGEKLRLRQKVGVVIGFVGILIAISPQLFDTFGLGLAGLGLPILVNLLAMVAVTCG